MRYCKLCLMPDTKPHLTFDDGGVCGACLAHRRKNDATAGIDWAAREAEFERLIEQAKAVRAPLFDVLVPVSGGKDSISQVHRVLGRGLRILAVNIDYGIKTPVGIRNLNLIPNMGANLIVYTPDQTLHRDLVRWGFEDFGDPDLLSHTLLHAMPLRIAVELKIPMVMLGENSAFEYGGEAEIAESRQMSHAWFMKYAANQGRDARFVAERYRIPYERLICYDYPGQLTASSTAAVFCSYFFRWDSEENFRIARTHGFTPLDHPNEGTYRTYVGIDEKINRIHQYFKVLKFGYGRATDHACEDIRNGRLSRAEAKELVRAHDLLDLSDSFVSPFIDFIGITRERFDQVVESYRNQSIWQRNNEQHWFIPGHLVDGD